jgi:hypothetical protein
MRVKSSLVRALGFVSALVAGCGDSEAVAVTGSGFCAGVDCSGHGTCEEVSGSPFCNCEPGYQASAATACLPEGAGGAGGTGGGAAGGTGGTGRDAGGFTNGTKVEGESCELHSECAERFWCAPAGFCSALISYPNAECKANADCGLGNACYQISAECVVGECGHDLDCDPPHCDTTGIASGTPYSCVECESSSQCNGGTCKHGVCG